MDEGNVANKPLVDLPDIEVQLVVLDPLPEYVGKDGDSIHGSKAGQTQEDEIVPDADHSILSHLYEINFQVGFLYFQHLQDQSTAGLGLNAPRELLGSFLLILNAARKRTSDGEPRDLLQALGDVVDFPAVPDVTKVAVELLELVETRRRTCCELTYNL